ncbi:MAG TPA: TetR/AcrR family transcriptional regulator [Acidimicrobiales bacterium]
MTVDEGRRRRSRRRARLDPETRRTQLIDAAVGLVDERGLAALGVDDVADAAGVSRSLVYAYFGDRDGLAAEVYVRMLARLDAHLELTLPLDEAAVREVVAGCMAFAEANPEAWRLLVSDPARQHPVVRQARADRAARLSELWRAACAAAPGTASSAAEAATAATAEAAATSSSSSPASPEPGIVAGGPLAAEAALGLLEAGVLHWLDHPEIPAEQAAGLLTSILWSGLAARPSSPLGAGS